MYAVSDDLVYMPILRDGNNERQVIEQFGGLARFDEGRDGKALVPLLEILEESSVDNLAEYSQAADLLLVEHPVYLTQGNHAIRDEIDALCEIYPTQMDFYREYKEKIDIPVITGPPGQDTLDSFKGAQSEFDQVAIRLLLESQLEEGELASANEIGHELRDDDLAVFDVVDNVEKREGDYGYLSALSDIYYDHTTIVANALNVYDGEPYNWGPEIAARFELEGFGDYAVGGRYPPIIPDFHEKSKYVRHYGIDDFAFLKFKGDNYEMAAQKLESRRTWEPAHCPFCQELSNRDSECSSHLAKRVRMGHYIHTAIQTDLEWLRDNRGS